MLKYLRLLPWVLAGTLAITSCALWYWPDTSPNYFSNTPRKPYVAPQSTIVTKVVREVVPLQIGVLKPTEKQEGAITKKLGEKLPEGDLFGVWDVPCPTPEVRVVGYLPPGSTTPEIKIYPVKTPFFQSLLKQRELGFNLGVRGYENEQGEFGRIYVEQGLLRTGRVAWLLRGEYEAGPAVPDSWAVMLEAKIKF